MNLPVLPSLQTCLSLLFSRPFLYVNGADLEWLLAAGFYLVVNVVVLAPALGQTMRTRLTLFAIFDLLPILAFLHLISWDWNYGPREMRGYREAHRHLAGMGGEELAYRKYILSEINAVFFWTADHGEASEARADLYDALPKYFADRDARLAAVENDYEDNRIGWWQYRHRIDALDTELSPGLGPYVILTPRLKTCAAYGSLFIGLTLLSIPLQGLVASLVGLPFQKSGERELVRRLAQFNQVEAMDGVYRGSFVFEPPFLAMRDLKVDLARSRWNPRDPCELLLPGGKSLRFSRRRTDPAPARLGRKSIFAEDD